VPRVAVVFIVVACVLAVLYILGSAEHLPRRAEQSISRVGEGVRSLGAGNTSSARESFSHAREAAVAGASSSLLAPELLFGEAPAMLRTAYELAGLGISVSDDIDYLYSRGLDALLGEGAEEVLARLARIAESLRATREKTQLLVSYADRAGMGAELPDFMASFAFDADEASRFADALLAWLRAPEGRRIAVLFQNPLEMRPAGGFLGSFADVEVRDGRVVSSTIRDITEADRKFSANIVPPKPLQGIMRRWRAADANWFFDFPASAAHVAAFLARSELYARASTTFDGIVAVSPRVLTDFLSRTGPLHVEGLGAVHASSALLLLQEDVVRREAQGDARPKQALQKLAEAVQRGLAGLGAEAKREAAELFPQWVFRRDILFYAAEPALQTHIESYGAGGEVARLPEDFEGDYLAIVDANVGGGKTDGVMASRVVWESQLGIEGIVANHLVLTRTHKGDASPRSWEGAINDDYLQVFVPPRSQLVNFSGGERVSAPARPEYAKSFEIDPLLAELELGTEEISAFPQVSTRVESGKRVFAARVRVPAGEARRVVLDYTHRLYTLPRNGTRYRFLFERQAGSAREYQFTVSAPVGFRFRETNLPVWNMATGDPPGRFAVDLTLESISE
jgi:hypothetical protein